MIQHTKLQKKYGKTFILNVVFALLLRQNE